MSSCGMGDNEPMSILELLGWRRTPRSGNEGSETVRKIARQLDSLPPERAQFVAAFAYVLGRVAHADHQVSEAETATMERLVARRAGLPEEQAVLVVEMAKSQNRLFGGTENFLVTRDLRESTSEEERRRLLDLLFAVSAADDEISAVEEAQIRQIASELGLTLADFVEARAAWAGKRSVLRALRRGGEGEREGEGE
jgi:uncharacterized tellurite resistance protein B-like protein